MFSEHTFQFSGFFQAHWFCDAININCQRATGFQAVYRLCAGMAVFYFLFMLLMYRVQSSRDVRAKIQNGFWFFKFIIMAGIIFGLFYVQAEDISGRKYLSNRILKYVIFIALMWIGMIGGFLFILIQLILVSIFVFLHRNSLVIFRLLILLMELLKAGLHNMKKLIPVHVLLV